MSVLDSVDWSGNILKAGAWQPGRGGDYAVVEPATGAELGRMGLATAADVADAAAAAAEAQLE
ncbi:benzaldehyde dehydrogenase, partial [Nocardioides sp. NPDC000441]